MYGIVFDTTQLITKENFFYGMQALMKARTYSTLDLSSIFTEDNVKELKVSHHHNKICHRTSSAEDSLCSVYSEHSLCSVYSELSLCSVY